MKKIHQLRIALTDVVDWAAWHIRREIDVDDWAKIISNIAEIKVILDKNEPVRPPRFDLDDVIDRLERGV